MRKKLLLIIGVFVAVLGVLVTVLQVERHAADPAGDERPGGILSSIFGDDSVVDGTTEILPDDEQDPRFRAYAEKTRKLMEEYVHLPKDQQDPGRMAGENARLLVDWRLGENHPKRDKFAAVMETSYRDREPLNQRYIRGEITREQMTDEMLKHVKSVQERLSALLTDEEYILLFRLKKTDDLASAMGIGPKFLAMAKEADEAEARRPKLSAEAQKEVETAVREGRPVDKKFADELRRVYGDPIGEDK